MHVDCIVLPFSLPFHWHCYPAHGRHQLKTNSLYAFEISYQKLNQHQPNPNLCENFLENKYWENFKIFAN